MRKSKKIIAAFAGITGVVVLTVGFVSQAAADALSGSSPVGDLLYFDCGGYGYQIGDHYFH